ncbi:MAG: GTP cyclohydrolase II [Bacteroidetes bacterium]|jgi:GTP cyclohydrolase II|nr:GTP cyclohydrolase II [Bacteroidota bacterium]
MELISEAQLPTKFGNFTIKVFNNPISLVEHFVLQNSENETAIPMVRIHSECATGDIFGSLRCDCQDQLHQALELIADNKNGAVIYLKNQEGRGIGISNKIKAYHLQEQGLNTYEANEALGLPADARNYDDATAILKILGYTSITLITNNPLKEAAVKAAGITFTTHHVNSATNEHNKAYLDAKINIGQHHIKL